MKKIIVTGFQPFGPYEFNPVEESTNHFNGKQIGEYDIKGVVLPCTYKGAFEVLKNALYEVGPSAIISTGLASSVGGIRLETVGKNVMEGKYPDAEGYEPKGVPIIEGEREFLGTNSDNVNLANILHKEGIPTEVSSDADAFICNSLIYLTTHHIQANDLKIKNAFIHTPWTTNYQSKIKLEPGKKMIPLQTLYDSIESVIRNI